MSSDFFAAVREGDWALATSLVVQRDVAPFSDAPSPVYVWLVELNAPPRLIVDLLHLHGKSQPLDKVKKDLMETCLRESTTKGNAFETFALLLADGVSPNLIVDGGSTLLQKAMELNRAREVRELLRYGADPNQTSVFGRESSTNLEEAARLDNEAAKIALTAFRAKG
jgi:hypothetical protein